MVFDVLGYSAEDIPELNFWDAVHPDYRDLVRERGNARLRGEDVPSSYEVRFLTKSGEPRWGLYSAAVITYEGTPAVIGTVYDITERKEAEEALRASEERYRMLYEDNPSMYFTLCEGLTVLAVNNYGAEQLGYEPEDLIGEPVLEVVHPGDRSSVRRQLTSLLKGGGARHELEFRKVRKNGEMLWVKETVRRTIDPDGKTVLLVVCEDITERKRTEETLRRLREDLERKVEKVLGKGNPYDLSFREVTVLHLVVSGRSDKEIAVTLGIRPLTVSKHVANVLKKMNAASRTEAGVRAWREGLIG
jgi:PAS domain S-box-containing protein